MISYGLNNHWIEVEYASHGHGKSSLRDGFTFTHLFIIHAFSFIKAIEIIARYFIAFFLFLLFLYRSQYVILVTCYVEFRIDADF